jgi:hypothetical protein
MSSKKYLKLLTLFGLFVNVSARADKIIEKNIKVPGVGEETIIEEEEDGENSSGTDFGISVGLEGDFVDNYSFASDPNEKNVKNMLENLKKNNTNVAFSTDKNTIGVKISGNVRFINGSSRIGAEVGFKYNVAGEKSHVIASNSPLSRIQNNLIKKDSLDGISLYHIDAAKPDDKISLVILKNNQGKEYLMQYENEKHKNIFGNISIEDMNKIINDTHRPDYIIRHKPKLVVPGINKPFYETVKAYKENDPEKVFSMDEYSSADKKIDIKPLYDVYASFLYGYALGSVDLGFGITGGLGRTECKVTTVGLVNKKSALIELMSKSEWEWNVGAKIIANVDIYKTDMMNISGNFELGFKYLFSEKVITDDVSLKDDKSTTIYFVAKPEAKHKIMPSKDLIVGITNSSQIFGSIGLSFKTNSMEEEYASASA